MPIPEERIDRRCLYFAPDTPVGEIYVSIPRDERLKTWIAVARGNNRYAVFRLGDLIAAFKRASDRPEPWMLDRTLAEIPGFLDAFTRPAILITMDEDGLDDIWNPLRDPPLVVLKEGEPVGILKFTRRGGVEDVDWFDKLLVRANGGERAEPEPSFGVSPDVLDASPDATLAFSSPTPPPSEPETRFLNAEIDNHPQDEPLTVGKEYVLAIYVDEKQEAAVATAPLPGGLFQPEEDYIVLTVKLASEDFEIPNDEQRLKVPRRGASGKVRFDIKPLREGLGVITAIFLKETNFVQQMTIKLPVRPTAGAGAMAAETAPGQPQLTAAGRSLASAAELEPRDLNLTIVDVGSGFMLVLTGSISKTVLLPIKADYLHAIIAQARQALLDIVNFRFGPRNETVYLRDWQIPPEAHQQVLPHLARAGYRLYQQLFYGDDAGPAVNALGDYLRELADQEKLKLQISSKHFLMPWGMLYLAADFDAAHIDVNRFLGFKHVIEHIPLQEGLVSSFGCHIDAEQGLNVGLYLNADIDLEGYTVVREQMRYWQEWQRQGKAKVVVRRHAPEVKTALQDTATPYQLHYFYAHGVTRGLQEVAAGNVFNPDDSALLFSGAQPLRLGDLRIEASPAKHFAGAPLVFLNACESAELSPLFYDGFVTYFVAKGARGVIGTECPTPIVFAAEFAKRFFARFLNGETLGETLLALRREFLEQHNNVLGLLYALYCDGDTRVRPPLTV